MRLIDADELLLRFIPRGGDNPFTRFVHETVRLRIEEMPTIEAEPVKHGRWIDQYGDGDWHCSQCGAIVEKDEQIRHYWRRCYHCGAKMDEVEE